MAPSTLVFLLVTAIVASADNPVSSTLPSGAVYINPLAYNVAGANYTQWRTNDSFVGFNPTNTAPPFLQIFDHSMLNITGLDATIRLVASHSGVAVAHEAPIYVLDLNVVFFASFAGGPLSYSGLYNNSVVSMINMTQVDDALTGTTGPVNVLIRTVNQIYNKSRRE